MKNRMVIKTLNDVPALSHALMDDLIAEDNGVRVWRDRETGAITLEHLNTVTDEWVYDFTYEKM